MKFRIYNEGDCERLAKALSDEIGCDPQDALELLCGYSSVDDEIEVAVCAVHGSLVIRIFDYGSYLFTYPYPMREGADIAAAIEAVAEYARLEEIPLVFTDTPAEELGVFAAIGFRHMDIDAEDANAASYRVRVKSECELLSRLPSVESERLTLSPLSDDDTAEYALISREESGLRFWGYDYRDDAPHATDEYFMEVARGELARGVALSLAARREGRLIGEVVYYGFDKKGGADFAFRLLPEYRGRGLGAELFLLAADAAREIGLLTLFGDVDKRNTACITLIAKRMEKIDENDSSVRFGLEL